MHPSITNCSILKCLTLYEHKQKCTDWRIKWWRFPVGKLNEDARERKPSLSEGHTYTYSYTLNFFQNEKCISENTFLQLCSSLELSLAPEKKLFCSSPILTLKLKIKIQYAELHCHKIADIYRLSADKNVSIEDLYTES